jgi:hypothetical protein
MELTELTKKLPGGQITNVALSDHETGESIIAYARQLAGIVRRQLKHHEKDSLEHWFLTRLGEGLNCFRWSFPLKLRKVKVCKADRSKPMLSGPLFTSERHPWPKLKDRYREPVAQIDMKVAGGLVGTDLGEGLLQLWVGPDYDDHLIRVIPAEDLASEALSAVPDCVTVEYFEKAPFSAGSWRAWPDAEGKGHVHAIVGVKLKVLSWPSWLKEADDDFDFDEKYGQEFHEVLREFLDLLPYRAPDEGHHLFGNFYDIQYTIEESAPTLLGLESSDPFGWGDAGNAQVSFHRTRGGKIRFGFNWSCY